MRKTTIVVLGIALLLTGLTWYLFLKPYDYLVAIKANTFPAAVGQSIQTWGKNMQSDATIDKTSMDQLTHNFKFNDSIHRYQWKITPLTDSTSKVKVYVTDSKNSFFNKLTIPFSKTDFEKRTEKTLVDFTYKLKEYIDHFKVTIIGEGVLNATYCACVQLKGKQSEKAFGMMQNYAMLSNFMVENHVQLNGNPFVEITKWDKAKERISYNFCYPIIKSDSLPQNNTIKYTYFNGGKALKAIYNGNYMTSHLAWYQLMDYAKKNNKKIEELPIEIFYNNPNVGGDELNWKAEIYLPLKP